MSYHRVHRGSRTGLPIGKGPLGQSGTKSHRKTRRSLKWDSLVSPIHVNYFIWCLHLFTGFWISYRGNWSVDVSLEEREAMLPILQFCWYHYSKLILFMICEKHIWSSEFIYIYLVFLLRPGSRATTSLGISSVLPVIKVSCVMWMRWLLEAAKARGWGLGEPIMWFENWSFQSHPWAPRREEGLEVESIMPR